MTTHKRGPWSQTEDQLLVQLVSAHSASNWVKISSAIGTRSAKQCRERFHQNLKPNLNHEPISAEEGQLIEQMVAEMGKRWAEIARRLRGRSDNAVKNWWNGGMNRRKRSNQQRRAELEVRHQAHAHNHMQNQAQMMHQQQPLPTFAPQHLIPQQYFAQQMLHPGSHMHSHMPQHLGVAAPNMPTFNRHGMIETPLPSPSAFSQMSGEGAPSLISDCSSMSTRSPHNGTSPIELPPLSAAKEERRHSSAPMVRMGVPAAFPHEADFQMQAMPMQRYDDLSKHQPQQQPMLQEAFMPQQTQYPIPYSPSQFQRFAQMPQHPPHMSVHLAMQQMQQVQRRHSAYPMHSQHIPSTPTQSHMTGMGKMDPNDHHHLKGSMNLDPALATPIPSAPTPDGSPKDKMSLSNLTH